MTAVPSLMTETQWESVLMTVSRCVECPESPCMRACPQAVDIRDALRFLIDTHPDAARFRALRAAQDCGEDGRGCE